MSLHTLANHLQSAGRGEDKVLVHMTPREVQSLQTLAMAHGGSLTINPQTGLPEAGFLSSLLPILAGAFLGPAGLGIQFGGLSSAMSTGLLTAGIGTLATGSLGKGLMMGLGAYGGAGLGEGIFGTAASRAAGTAASAGPVGAVNNLSSGYTTIQPTAAVPSASSLPPGLHAATVGQGYATAPGGVQPTMTIKPPASMGGYAQSATGFEGAGKIPGVAEAVATPQPKSIFDVGKENIGKLFSGGEEGAENRKKFLSEYGLPLAASGASMYMLSQDEQKRPQQAPVEPIRPSRTYTGEYIASPTPGLSGERQYTFMAEGGLANLPVEQMSQQASTGANTNYPMANIRPYGYAVPRNVPISENVFKPMDYQRTDPYTGEQQFAGGGIVALATGGFVSKLKAVPKPTEPKPKLQSTAAIEKQIASLEKYGNVDELKGRYNDLQNQIKERQAEKKNKDAEAAQRLKEYNAEVARVKAEQAARIKEINAEYAARTKQFNADTANELKSRQQEIAGTKDANERKRKQTELANWQKGRSAELAGIANEQKSSITGTNNDYANRLKEAAGGYNQYKAEVANWNKEYSAGLANLNKELAPAKSAASMAAQYQTAVANRDKIIAANEAATAKARSTFESAMDKYNQYQDALAAEKQAWQEQTGRQATGVQSLRPSKFDTAETIQEKIRKLQEQKLDIITGKAQAPATPNTSWYGLGAPPPKASETSTDNIDRQIAALNAQLKTAGQYKPVTKVGYDSTTKRLMEEKDITAIFEDVAGRRPTSDEMQKLLGTTTTDAAIASFATKLPDVTAKMSYTDDDLRENWQYYTGREPTSGELAAMKKANPGNFNQLRDFIQKQPAFLENINRQGLESIIKGTELPIETVASAFKDVLGRQPTAEEINQYSKSQTQQSLIEALKKTEDYKKKFVQGLVPGLTYLQAEKYAPGTVLEYKPTDQAQTGLGAISGLTPTPSGLQTPQTRGPVTIQGAMPLNPTFQEQLGLQTLASQAAQVTPPLQQGLRFDVPAAAPAAGQLMPGLFGMPSPQRSYEEQLADIGAKQVQPAVIQAQQSNAAPQVATVPLTTSTTTMPTTAMAMGGYAGGGYHLGDYSDGGRLLKGPGDGVSDSIPASIGNRQPARLADGEFVIPARIVSEIGNGSTDAGARKLYAMMDRIQRARRKSIGKGRVAVDSKAEKLLPA